MALFVPQNKHDGIAIGSSSKFMPYCDTIETVVKNTMKNPEYHTLDPATPVKGYTHFVHDPSANNAHLNDTASRYFRKARVASWPGHDECGIFGDVIFYNKN